MIYNIDSSLHKTTSWLMNIPVFKELLPLNQLGSSHPIYRLISLIKDYDVDLLFQGHY